MGEEEVELVATGGRREEGVFRDFSHFAFLRGIRGVFGLRTGDNEMEWLHFDVKNGFDPMLGSEKVEEQNGFIYCLV
jgi:hypothetical protein